MSLRPVLALSAGSVGEEDIKPRTAVGTTYPVDSLYVNLD